MRENADGGADLIRAAVATQHRRRVARSCSRPSPASGRSCRTRSGRRSTRRPSPTATSSTARRRRAIRSGWRARRCSTTARPPQTSRAPEFNEHGDEILADARPRLGRHRRPQGPRRHRLDPTNRTDHQGAMHMGLFDAYGYKGKRTLVVGGSSGMGAATVDVLLDAGADVTMMDWAERREAGRHVPLPQPRRAAPRSRPPRPPCDGPIDALFSCAGVADGTPGIEKINFLGHRLLIELLRRRGQAPPRLGHRHDLLGRRLRLGAEPRAGQRVPRHRRLRRGVGVGRRPRQGRLPLEQGRHQRLRGARGDRVPEAGHPDQRHPPGPHRHARSPRPTPTPGSPSAPTTGRWSASRPPRRSSRPTRWCSSAATPPPASPASCS